jgi:elongation factor Tu
LLVDGTEEAARQAIEHVLLARQVNVGHMVVFVNKMDLVAASDRAEIEQLIEMEIGAMLATHGYRDVPFVLGSALKALAAAERGDLEGPDVQCVIELVEALDSRIPDPVRDYDGPFMMPARGRAHHRGSRHRGRRPCRTRRGPCWRQLGDSRPQLDRRRPGGRHWPSLGRPT